MTTPPRPRRPRRPNPRRAAWLVVVACTLAVSGVTGVGAPAVHADAAAAHAVLLKPPVPADGAYLGAYVEPLKATTSDPAPPDEQAQTTAFEGASGIDRPLGIDNHFYPWLKLAIGPAQYADAQAGVVPMLSWVCGNDAQILSGAEDSVIEAAATSIKDFGHPVIVRYAWEMNLDSARNRGCQGTLGPAGFVLAWQHIVDLFQTVGATNAAFAWVISSAVPGAAADQYYPGDRYVDWVGADGYARQPTGGAFVTPRSFASIFAGFASEWSGRKPIMVGETGVQGVSPTAPPAAQAQAQAAQVAWLADMFAALQTPQFADIKAVSYYDSWTALGHFELLGPAEAAFATGGAEAYFHPGSPVVPLAFDPGNETTVPASPHTALDVPVEATGSPAATLAVSGTLPSGVRFVAAPGANTGTFVGEPRLPGQYAVELTATSSAGAVQQNYTFQVTSVPLFMGVAQVLRGAAGAPASFPISTAAYPADRVTVSGLPAHFSFRPDGAGGGTIVGTALPQQGGSYPVTVTATNTLGSSTKTVRLVLAQTAAVATTDAVAAYTGLAFSTTVGTVGYPVPALRVTGLPRWLHARNNRNGTATLFGVPVKPAVFSLQVVLTQTTYAAASPTTTPTATSNTSTYDLIVTVH